MSRGQAYGRDRDYQVQCRDVLIHRDPTLVPYSGDGVDVPFDLGGTTWALDIALRAPAGGVLVAECRRRGAGVKQEDVAAFAYKVDLLRQHLAEPVAGVFLTKTAHQIGAVKAGQFADITMAVLSEGQAPPGFSIAFHRYDAERAQRRRDYVLHVAPGRLQFSATLDVKLIRGGGRVDDA